MSKPPFEGAIPGGESGWHGHDPGDTEETCRECRNHRRIMEFIEERQKSLRGDLTSLEESARLFLQDADREEPS